MTAMQAGVVLNNLTVSYQRRPAVHHVNGVFAKGVGTAVVGPNGAGKSTLLKAIAGMLPAEQGVVQFLSVGCPKDLAYLPQQSELDLGIPMTVFELVASGLWRRLGAFAGLGTRERAQVLDALAQVGLAEFAQRPLAALSIGQLQRVLFARIVVQDAQVILLDEPFNHVDARSTDVLLALMHRWQAEGRTVIAVLHDMAQVKSHFQSVLLLAHEVIAWGAPDVVLSAELLLRANERCAHWFEHGQVCAAPDVLLENDVAENEHAHFHTHLHGHTHGHNHAHTHSNAEVK